jgi:hypothetical protein
MLHCEVDVVPVIQFNTVVGDNKFVQQDLQVVKQIWSDMNAGAKPFSPYVAKN